MNKKRKVGITIVLCLIIVISSVSAVLIINGFNFKTLEFDKKYVDKDNDNSNNEDEDIKITEPIDLGLEDDRLSNDEGYNDSDDKTTTTTATVSTTKVTGDKKSSTTKKTTTSKTTTTKKTSNPNKPAVSTDKFDNDINSVKLNPMITRHKEVDNKAISIINSVTNSSMTNNQKLYAIFRYVIDNAEYGNAFYDYYERKGIIDQYHYVYFDGKVVHGAKRLLDSKIGVCDDYASLLTVLARRIGFEAYFVGGQVKKSGGGTTGHAWVYVKANGTYYILDAQIADKRPEQEKAYYGKTDAETPLYTCDREANIKAFNSFKETSPLKLTINLSGGITDTQTINSYSSNILRKEYSVKAGSQVNFVINMSGDTKYRYSISVSGNESKTIYASSGYEAKNSVNFTYNYPAEIVGGNYYYQISVWGESTGNIAEYYFYVNPTSANEGE